jgi:transposase
LSALVEQEMKHRPLDGDVYLFLGRKPRRAKVLYFNGTGLCLLAKRLEAGTFRLVHSADGNKSHVEIDAVELGLMLEGIDLGTVKRRKRFKWEPQSTTEEKSATT